MNIDKRKVIVLKIGIIVVVVLIYIFCESVQKNIKQVIFIMSNLDVALIKGYISSFGYYAPFVSFLLMIFQSIVVPLPAFLITLANAGIFGWAKGAMLSWSSAIAGAMLCFFITKFYVRNEAEKFVIKFNLRAIDTFFDMYGHYIILMARLIPFMPFDIVSYAAGLTSISLWQFFWATSLGQLPATIIYSYLGVMMTRGTKKIVFYILMIFSISISTVLIKKICYKKKYRKKQKRSDRNCLKQK